jgi:ATP-dependent DNA helicase RecQ
MSYSGDLMNNKTQMQNYERQLLDSILSLEYSDKDIVYSDPHVVLNDVFKFKEFKPQQFEIITRVLNKDGDSLGIMPTGGGKTLCFQIPSLIQSNLTIVVSPLIALMKDQIDNLRKKGVKSAFFINSSLSDYIKGRILDLVESKKVKLLYIAPESLKSEYIQERLTKLDIDLFVIDEAHCISTWGHDFRPDYLTLPNVIRKLNNPQILALTATATKEVEEDIQRQLDTKCKVFKSSFDRPNLYIEAIQLADNANKNEFLFELLQRLQGPTIIFVTFTKTAENLCAFLNNKGFECIFYHGRIKKEDRDAIQNQFISGKCDIIVTTTAFGMGIDKPDIRNIIHYNISHSVESYYQEIGRAGRDNNRSNCITLLSEKDKIRLHELMSSGWPDKRAIEGLLSYLSDKDTRYFFASIRKVALDCKIGDTPTKLILQQLEEQGAIKTFDNVIYRIKLKL